MGVEHDEVNQLVRVKVTESRGYELPAVSLLAKHGCEVTALASKVRRDI